MSLTLPDKKQGEIHTCSVLGGAPHWRHALFSQINSKLLLQKQGWLSVRKHHQHVSINCNRLTLDLACSFALSNISCVTLLKAFTAQGLENHEASEIEI